MAASDNVTTVLNKAHAMELQAITQYTNQYINLYRADFVSLADKIKSIAIEEMEHYNQIGTRIKELGGEPNVTMAKVPETNQDIKNIFKFDMTLENDTMRAYNAIQITCRENDDIVSATLMEEITTDEQKHAMIFTKINEHIATYGDSYLSNIAGLG